MYLILDKKRKEMNSNHVLYSLFILPADPVETVNTYDLLLSLLQDICGNPT
jgi:hypothetical protein